MTLEQTGAHETRLRLSSCRIHSTTRFQLTPVWSTNYNSTDDLALQTFIRYDVHVNGEPRAVVVGKASAEVEGDLGINNISVIAVDTADNESAPGTTTLNL